jgi:uncharacterized membrane protein
MRDEIFKNKEHDPRINYRGANPSRLDNLTDGVFGIAISLLIFNLANPNSFQDLLTFTKTLPAFLISIAFLVMIWNEHLRFSEIYALNDTKIVILNTIFIGLIIFYVYPLRFLTLFLTNFFFQANIQINIQGDQVPQLMVYYGFIAFALYFILYLFYIRAFEIKGKIALNEFECFYTNSQIKRLLIMFSVPLLSIFVTVFINSFSYIWASTIGGAVYCLYSPLILHWYKNYKKKLQNYETV